MTLGCDNLVYITFDLFSTRCVFLFRFHGHEGNQMTTGLFIILRWALTFGVSLAIAAHQLMVLRKDEVEQRQSDAAAVPAE